MIICQCCVTRQALVVVIDDDPAQPYLLCHRCESRLRRRALRPREWFRLASVHGPWNYHLHDDFYDDDGKACQPETRVTARPELAFPRLEDVSADLGATLDLAMSQWFLRVPVVAALKGHDCGLLLAQLQALVESRPNAHVESRSYQIAARVLGAIAGPWLRERWCVYGQSSLPSLIEASAACLPFEDAYPRAVHSVHASEPRELPTLALALAHFRSSRTLDWIEAVVTSPVTENWGRLAAASGFDWPRGRLWLARGRPLSLVALDALSCILSPPPHGTPLCLIPAAPSIPDREALDLLRAHQALDPAPRVRNSIDRIIAALAQAT